MNAGKEVHVHEEPRTLATIPRVILSYRKKE